MKSRADYEVRALSGRCAFGNSTRPPRVAFRDSGHSAHRQVRCPREFLHASCCVISPSRPLGDPPWYYVRKPRRWRQRLFTWLQWSSGPRCSSRRILVAVGSFLPWFLNDLSIKGVPTPASQFDFHVVFHLKYYVLSVEADGVTTSERRCSCGDLCVASKRVCIHCSYDLPVQR